MNNRNIRIAPSILSADFSRLGDEVRVIEAVGSAAFGAPDTDCGCRSIMRRLRECSAVRVAERSNDR